MSLSDLAKSLVIIILFVPQYDLGKPLGTDKEKRKGKKKKKKKQDFCRAYHKGDASVGS